MTRRAALIVIDGLGIGTAHDQPAYGDQGSDTLGNVCRTLVGTSWERGGRWPNLERLGLGNCAALVGLPPAARPIAAFGTAQPKSAGKDSTTGHWEICGLVLDRPFPTFPRGFPSELIDRFARATGRSVLGNKPASGTAILDELGERHLATGSWIVYTSADSVFQIAAHEDVVPVGELYRACAKARELCAGDWGVSRVIARPFQGRAGAWVRTGGRQDFAIPPTAPTLLDRLAAGGVPTVGVGKVDDLFAKRGISSTHAMENQVAFDLIERGLRSGARGFIFANVIEFDQTWGHRNDVSGFIGGLDQLDRAVPRLLAGAQPDDLIIFTADHGNDPTTPSTDHSRERVPILVYGPRVRPVSLGERPTFADIGQTIAQFLGVEPIPVGTSFLGEIGIGDSDP